MSTMPFSVRDKLCVRIEYQRALMLLYVAASGICADLNAKKARREELRLFLAGVGGAGATMLTQISQPRTSSSQVGQTRSSSRLKRKASTPSSMAKSRAANSNKRSRVASPGVASQVAPAPSHLAVERELATLDGEITHAELEGFRQYQAQREAHNAHTAAVAAVAQVQKDLLTFCHVQRSEASAFRRCPICA